MRHVGFILKPEMNEANRVLEQLVPWLIAEGHVALVAAEDSIAPRGARIIRETEMGDVCDLMVVLGGDGTMLRASDLVADAGVPVLGINLGRLGFLTPFDSVSAQQTLAMTLDGTLPSSQRMRLSVTYFPQHGKPVTRNAVNEAVIHQGAMARLIELQARADGDLIAAYRVDGLIICTPTGSTGYNLAAGGPILVPGQEAMALTPICAHALTHRPLVLAKSATISVVLDGSSHGVALTVDGQWARSFKPGDRVEITSAEIPLIVYESDKSYFDILRTKLHWGVQSAPEVG